MQSFNLLFMLAHVVQAAVINAKAPTTSDVISPSPANSTNLRARAWFYVATLYEHHRTDNNGGATLPVYMEESSPNILLCFNLPSEWNDRASAIYVDWGRYCRFYEHEGCYSHHRWVGIRGPANAVDLARGDFANDGSDLNDQISSISCEFI